MAQLVKYPSYKPSGVPWLGDVPEHWEISNAKRIFSTIDIRSKTGDEELLSVSERLGVSPRKNVNVTMFKAESYLGYKLCWPGDLVINSLWAWMNGLGFSEHHGIISSAYGVYRLNGKYHDNYHYFNYLLRSIVYSWEFRVNSKGIWRSRYQLTDESFFKIPIILPPLTEQIHISRFLDWKTSQINKFIKAKKRIIELLKEQKQAIINDAVTGKMDVRTGKPYPKYKPSGVEWLGDIPEEWKVRRLKNVAKIYGRIGFRGYQQSDLVPEGMGAVTLSPRNIQDGNLSLKKLAYLSWEKYFESPEIMVFNGDIILCKTGSSFGKAALVPTNEYKMTINPQLIVIKNIQINKEFFLYILTADLVQNQISKYVIGGAIPTIGQNFLSSIYLLFPNEVEQQQIFSFIQNQLSTIDTVISRINKEIELVKEYKSKLIADVVTGKIDVRGIEVPEVIEEIIEEPMDNDIEDEIIEEEE